MEKLSGLDSGFFYLDSPGMHLHIGVVLILSGQEVTLNQGTEVARAQILARLPAMEHFCHVIAEVPFGLAEPYWIKDSNFDIAHHVVEIDDAKRVYANDELLEFAGNFISQPLDKSRPLWEVIVVPQVEGEKFALVAKLHHALVDGVQGIQVLGSLFDLEPHPSAFWGVTRSDDSLEITDPFQMLSIMGASIASKARNAPKDALRAVGLVSEWLSFRSTDDNAELVRPVFGAPKTPINGTLSKNRVARSIELPLALVKELARTANVTVNDFVMLLVSLGLDDYLLQKGWPGGEDLTAMMPIANPQRDKGGGSNQITSLFVSLANSVPDPLERLKMISRATKAAKKFHARAGLADFVQLAEYIPPIFTWAVSRLAHQSRVFDRLPPFFNLLVSTVHGTDFPLFFAGAELLEIIPFGPLADSSALNVTALSYNHKMTLGFVGEATLAGDVGDFGVKVLDALEDVKHRIANAAD